MPAQHDAAAGTGKDDEDSGHTDEMVTEGAAKLKGPESLRDPVGVSFDRLQPHEKEQGHPAWMLQQLLTNAPLEAEIWDLLGHALKASRAVGLPPATAGAPGKQLVIALFASFCEQKGALSSPPTAQTANPEQEAEEKKARFEQWKDLSELLESALVLMFQRAATLGS